MIENFCNFALDLRMLLALASGTYLGIKFPIIIPQLQGLNKFLAGIFGGSLVYYLSAFLFYFC